MNPNQPDKRKWYLEKPFLIPAAILGLLFIIGIFADDTSPTPTQIEVVNPEPTTIPKETPVESTAKETTINDDVIEDIIGTFNEPEPEEEPVITETFVPEPEPQQEPKSYTPPPPVKKLDFSSGSSYSCNCSKTCTQMISCEEAYYQLNSCGCSQRDGDDDGIPCESICQ